MDINRHGKLRQELLTGSGQLICISGGKVQINAFSS
ncbi:MAG: hypothetical protein ACJA0Z_002810 [Halioglobus sp.]|jgi:hypothetical protein